MLGSRAMPAAQITLTPKSEVLRELIVVKGVAGVGFGRAV
jgi:hypothetical protein